jgi:hypothetical protein
MPLLQPNKDFLRYLKQNGTVRAQIRAARGRTLRYVGSVF